jgi:hypothetical protein
VVGQWGWADGYYGRYSGYSSFNCLYGAVPEARPLNFHRDPKMFPRATAATGDLVDNVRSNMDKAGNVGLGPETVSQYLVQGGLYCPRHGRARRRGERGEVMGIKSPQHFLLGVCSLPSAVD